MEQTALGQSTSKNTVQNLVFSAEEKQVLRKLAGEVGELAARPVEAEKRILWTRHNDLEPVRPLVFCDPENGWNEIIPEKTLLCRNELARNWEMTLRKEIFWATKMGDDRVTEPYFNIPLYIFRVGLGDASYSGRWRKSWCIYLGGSIEGLCCRPAENEIS